MREATYRSNGGGAAGLARRSACVVPSISPTGVAPCCSTPATTAGHAQLQVAIDLPHLFITATQRERNASRAAVDMLAEDHLLARLLLWQLSGLTRRQGVGVTQPSIVEPGHDDTSYKMGDPCVEEVTDETCDTSQEAKGVAF